MSANPTARPTGTGSRRVRGRRLALTACGLVVAGSVLGGCGEDDPAPAATPSGPTASASGSTTGEVGVAAMGRARSATDLGRRLRKAVLREESASVQFAPEGAIAGASRGVIRFGEKEPAFTLSIDDPAKPMTMVAVPSGLYMQAPEKLDGKSWLKLTATLQDVEGDDAFSGIFAEIIDSARSSIDVLLLTDALGEAKSFTVGAVEQVDGVPVTRYTVELGEKGLRKQLSEGMLKRAKGQLKGATNTTEILVDADWLPRRVVTATLLEGRTLKSTVTYADWGRAAAVTEPPAADTARVEDYPDVTDIQRQISGL